MIAAFSGKRLHSIIDSDVVDCLIAYTIARNTRMAEIALCAQAASQMLDETTNKVL